MVKLYSFTSTITDKSIEEKIVERAASKMRLDQLVIQQGVCDGLQKELPKAKAKNDALEKEQLKVWFEQVNQISNITIKAYLQILLLTGARRNELATLKWIDVDLAWNKITIRDKAQKTRTLSTRRHRT
jgi:integrase